MTNTESDIEYELCPAGRFSPQVEQDTDPEVLILEPRVVPLGGPRAMNVRRTLPHRERSFVGAWCFVDHYGPDDIANTTGMNVPPHPHTGLQTVSWLFSGEIEHRDSGGVHGMVRPGEVNLMTGGAGICHSEVSIASTGVLHGVQLWVVLPDADRHTARDFRHYAAPLIQAAPGISARVFIGELAGHSSPITTFTPLLGAELQLAANTEIRLPVNPSFEHALLVDEGSAEWCGTALKHGELGIVDAGLTQVRIATTEPTRLILLGGTPFDEEIIMWWNFVGRSHEEIVEMREEWQAHSDRFGEVLGYSGPVARLPAPEMPGVRLRPRNRSGRH